MPHEGTHLEPTVERRDGKVIPTHRWKQTSKDPSPSADRTGLADATAAVAGETYAADTSPSTPGTEKSVAKPILDAVQAIAARCDGAHEKDLQGFNAGDTTFGRALAFVPVDDWDPATTWEAHRMLAKYRKQLDVVGHPYDTLPVPDRPDGDPDDREIGKRGRQLVRDPYNAHQKEVKKAERDAKKRQQRDDDNRAARNITFDDTANQFVVRMDRKDHDAREALKADVPGRRFDWDAAAWHVPASSAEPLMAYAANWDFEVSGSTQQHFDAAAEQATQDRLDPNYDKKQNGTVTLQGNQLAIDTPYNPDLVEDVKRLPGRRWDGTHNIVALSPEALEFAEKYNLYVGDGIADTINAATATADRLTELSHADTADIHIDGFNVDLFDYQKAGIAYALEAKRTFLADQMGLGKGGTDDTKILTPTGWTTFAEISLGDRVIGADGQAHRVIGVYPRGELDVYRVTMSDGSSVLCDGDHLWQVSTAQDRFRNYHPRVRSTLELLEEGTTNPLNTNSLHFIPMVQPVEFDSPEPLPMDPYLLGALLGDGSFSQKTISFSTADDDMLTLLQEFLPPDTKLSKPAVRGNTKTVRIIRDSREVASNPAVTILQDLGLMGCRSETKFVPPMYLLGSAEDRLMLLRGLLDTDGHAGAAIEYSTVSPHLAEAVEYLVRSLGGITRTTMKKPTYTHSDGSLRTGRDAYRIIVSMPADMNPFLLKRKAEAWRVPWKYPPVRSIASIEPAGRANVTCIAVDAPDRLYVTDDFIVTHNTVQAIGTVHAADAYPAVVVCPATLKRNWEREFGAAVDGKNVVIVDGRTPVDLTGADVVILNYDVLQHHLGALQALNPKAAVFDESHYVKNAKAGRTVAALALADEIPADGYVLALSGTPVTNRTAEFVTQLQLLGQLEAIAPKPSNPVGSFLFRYCGPEASGYGNTYTYKGASNSEELQAKLRARCYVRRQKEDVLKDLPKKTRQTTLVDMEPDALASYRAAEKDFSTFIADRLVAKLREERKAANRAASDDPDDEYSGYSIDDIVDALDGGNDKYRDMGFRSKDEFDTWSRAALKAAAGETLAKAATLRRELGAAKIPAAIERIDEFRESTGRKIVVFAHHTEVVDRLADHYGAPKISGSVKLDDRQKAVDAFQNDPGVPIIVCNDRAAAEGITLTAASDVLMVEQDWVPMDQAEARVDRIGQTQPVTVHYLLAADTLDEQIHALVERKRTVVAAATDGTPAPTEGDDMDAVYGFLGI